MTPEPDPRTYTPPNLAEKILRDRFRLEGERRRVTILFVDTVESTSIAEQLDEEVVYGNIQRFVEEMLAAVHRYEGTVTQFTGDGILAIFGAPIAHEDSARRAVAAAIDMRDRLRKLGDEIEAASGVSYHFRIGLNTGPVVVGKITEDLSMQYSAIGDTVNLAARMEQAADPDSVFMTEQTYRLVSESCECDFVGPLDIKGKAEAINVYRAVRDLGLRTRIESAVQTGLTPYIGRESELVTLQGFFDKAKTGRGQVVFISGEAGIGKSRILYEFRKSLPPETRWLEGHCISFGRNISYLPMTEVVKRAFGVEETDDEARIIERLEQGTSRWEDRLSVPYLRFLLNVDPGDPEISMLDPRDRRSGILNALRHLLIESSKQGPVAVVIEDLHWVDEKSEEAIAALVDIVATLPVLMVLNYRPGYSHSLGDRGYYSRIALDRLDPGDTEEIAKAILHASDLPSELRDLITSKAEGNPFYVEEVTKSLKETGVVGVEDGTPVLLRPVEEIRIPENIHEIILARIDRLEAEAKQALQLASVIGREFTVRLLERIANVEDRLETALGELRSLELIYEKSFFPEVAYMFKHALTHDVAYSTLLKERRRALHLVVARAIEDLYSERLPEQYETLSHHFWEAQEWAKAAHYSHLAGEKAYAAYAGKEAMEFFGRAIEAGEKAGSEGIEPLCQSLLRRAFLTGFGGDLPAAISDLETMERVAAENGLVPNRTTAVIIHGLLLHIAHDADAAEQRLLEGVRLAEAADLDDLKLLSYTGLMEVYGTYNRFDQVEVYLAKAHALAGSVKDPFALSLWGLFGALKSHWQSYFEDSIHHMESWGAMVKLAGDASLELALLWGKGLSLAGIGRYEEAIDSLMMGLERAETLGESLFAARILNTMGWIMFELGDQEGSLDWNRRSLELTESIDAPDPEVECNARLNMADAYLATGRLADAEAHLEFVGRIVRNPAPVETFMLWRYSQHFFHTFGEWHLGAGRPEEALALGHECVEASRESGSRRNIVKGLRLVAQANLALGETETAHEKITEALDLAREVANPPQLWRSLEVMAKVETALGRGDLAAAALREANAVIEGVASDLKPERREIFMSSSEVSGILTRVP